MKRKLIIAISFFLCIAVLLAVWAFLIEPNRLIVKTYDLGVNNWSPKLNNFKIVAISDIHGGSNFIDEAKIREVVAQANAQNPDLIVLLGDYVSQQHFDRKQLKMPVPVIAENLKGLKAKYGVFAVLGNHDNWYDGAAVRRELERAGIVVLNNEATSIEKDGEKLRILGMMDVLQNGNWSESQKIAKDALAKIPDEGKIIILTHSPDSLNYLTENMSISPDAVLFFAGHTHGGQVRLPLIGAPVIPTEFGQKYAQGFVYDRGIGIFVTPGIGTSIMPVRFGVPPEISVLNISAEK